MERFGSLIHMGCDQPFETGILLGEVGNETCVPAARDAREEKALENRNARRRCRTCDFYDGVFCRRHPPVVAPEALGDDKALDAGVWPVVHDEDWCGEHKMDLGLA
jgi:hypothetical protein